MSGSWVCHNPKVAERDATVWANLIGRFMAMNAGTDRPTATHRPELRGVISTKVGLKRFLWITSASRGQLLDVVDLDAAHRPSRGLR